MSTRIVSSAVFALSSLLLCVGCGSGSGGDNAIASQPSDAASAPAAPPSPGSSLAAAAGSGTEVSIVSPDIMLMVPLPKPQPSEFDREGEGIYVDKTAMVIKHLAQLIQDGKAELPPDLKTISVMALRPDVDRLGNPKAYTFMTVQYAVDDLKAAKIKTLGAFGMLDLAVKVDVVEPWLLAVKPWCVRHTTAVHFCIQAHASDIPGLQ